MVQCSTWNSNSTVTPEQPYRMQLTALHSPLSTREIYLTKLQESSLFPSVMPHLVKTTAGRNKCTGLSLSRAKQTIPISSVPATVLTMQISLPSVFLGSQALKLSLLNITLLIWTRGLMHSQYVCNDTNSCESVDQSEGRRSCRGIWIG